jgi:nucleoside-diphosphate-sugar epimerase
MIRVMITGAAGFIGRQIIRALDVDGITLIPIVRSSGKNLFSEVSRVERMIVTPDLFSEDEVWWQAQCRDVDILIHAAWYAVPGKYLQSELNMDCLLGSLRMSRGASKAGVKRIVGIGTCAEYDQSAGVLKVDTPLKPLTPYACAKTALFLGLSNWLPTQSITFAWCRVFYLFGEGEDERRLVPYIRKQLQNGEPAELTSGTQIRDFINVVEAGKKIAAIALSDRTGPFNVSSGVPTTVRQLAEFVADEFGRRDLLKFGARSNNLFDPPCVIGIPNF